MDSEVNNELPAFEARVVEVVGESESVGAALGKAVELLVEALPMASWWGVYLLEGEMLVLGPYRGAATEHTRIPVGVGVCGMAVATGKNQLVEDVRTLDNYLACSISTRSELVVLVRSAGRIWGQLDFDSDRPGAFGPREEAVAQVVADALARRFEA